MIFSPGAINAFLVCSAVLAATTTTTNAFQTTPFSSSSASLPLSTFKFVPSSGKTATATPLFALSPEHEAGKVCAPADNGFASAMTAYMIRSHEEKLKQQQVLKEREKEVEVGVDMIILYYDIETIHCFSLPCCAIHYCS
jgi:hypothetical protein